MSPNPIQLPPEAAAALARGDLIGAVKVVREATGLSLQDAHDLVRARAHALRGASGDAQPGQAGFEFPPAAAAAVARGEFAHAIALLREANPQLDLRTAKDAIDHVRRGALPQDGKAHKNAFSGYPPRVPTVVAGDRGSRVWLKAMLAVVFAVFVLWLLEML